MASTGITRGRAVPQRRTRGISFEDMAARRAERLVNLVICLLSTRQFISADRIRDAVPGYEPANGTREADEAFKRMFERDKAELRELGIPLETGTNSAFETVEGYRIRRGAYELPPVEFSADEAIAIGLAARLWQSARLGQAAQSALMKLRAAGTDVRVDDSAFARPEIDASDPGLPVLLEAVRLAQPVSFDYVKSGAGVPVRRELEPWGVLSWRARWYVAGLDRGRGAPRSFRLSRITSGVSLIGAPGEVHRPDGVDLLAMVAGRDPEATRLARVRVHGPGAGALRRLAEHEDAGVLTIGYTETQWLARRVAAAGTSAHVLEPPELVAAVTELLRAAAGRAE